MNEVLIVMGMGAAGKSTHTQEYVARGYQRINRDELGGKLDGLLRHLDKAKAAGQPQIVMDNTYATAASRKPVIGWGKTNGYEVGCVWLDTSFEDAQLNACLRMVRKRGRLLMPEDFKTEKDPNLFPPVALFRYKKEFEKPVIDEGFAFVQRQPFVRIWGSEYTHSALIFDCDGVFRHTSGKEKYPCSPDEVIYIEGRGEVAKEQSKLYDHILGISNQSGIAKRKLTENACEATFARTNELTGLDIDWLYCPHNIPPVQCYCRKPSPGLGALAVETYKLLPSKCLFVGDQKTDETFAYRCGFQFAYEKDFF